MLLHPARLLAGLLPTRRILCLCTTQEADSVGMALSDPYLSHTEQLLPLSVLHRSGAVAGAVAAGCTGAGLLQRDVIDAVRLHDVGALLFAQPMRLVGGASEAEAMRLQHSAATAVMPACGTSQGCTHILGCLSDRPRPSVETLLRWYAEQPEMWEAIQGPLDELQQHWRQQQRLQVCPSVQAAVALNSFLWQHTACWQNNTFG